MNINKIDDALRRLNHTKGATFKCEDFFNLTDAEYLDSDVSAIISLSALQAELVLMGNEYDALQYQRDRAEAYPSLTEQADMAYWDRQNGTTTLDDAISAVKAEFPKP